MMKLTNEDYEEMERVLSDRGVTHWDMSQKRSGGYACWLMSGDRAVGYSEGETLREAIGKAHERFKADNEKAKTGAR